MNRIVMIVLTGSFLMACNSKPNQSITDPELVKKVSLDFLADLSSLQDVDDPINTFIEGAENAAAKRVAFTKDAANELVQEARTYAHAVIVVEDHTVIMLRNLDDCQKSLSWDCCMPMGEGYIKKGDLVYQEDYINNIIGMPDNKKRIIYFFTE